MQPIIEQPALLIPLNEKLAALRLHDCRDFADAAMIGDTGTLRALAVLVGPGEVLADSANDTNSESEPAHCAQYQMCTLRTS